MAKWTLFGRVLPERVPLTWETPIVARASIPGLNVEFEYRARIFSSQAIVDLDVTRGEMNAATMRNVAKDCVRTITDIVGYKQACSFDVEIVSGICQETGAWQVFGIEIPALRARRGAADLGALDGALVEVIHRDAGAKLALADFREAMRVALGTGFFCYRAIEALKQAVKNDPGEPDAAAWLRLRTVLCVDRSAIDRVKAYADAPRHGSPSSITDTARAEVFSITDEIIGRYLQYLVRGRVQLPEAEFPILKYNGPTV